MTESRPNPAPSLPDAGLDRDPFRGMKTGTLGMTIFLISLAALFGATMIGWLIMAIVLRNRTTFIDDAGHEVVLPPMPDLPGLPWLLWVSTLVILVSSGTIQWAKNSARRDHQPGVRRGANLTLMLGFVFLALQTVCWFQWVDRAWGAMDASHDAYRFAATGFLVLSGLHAAHVVGGLVPLIIVAVRARAGRYGPANHAGLDHVALYWHFLDVIWVIMFLGLVVAG